MPRSSRRRAGQSTVDPHGGESAELPALGAGGQHAVLHPNHGFWSSRQCRGPAPQLASRALDPQETASLEVATDHPAGYFNYFTERAQVFDAAYRQAREALLADR